MVLATGEGAGRAVVLCVAVAVGILYGAYKVLSIGRRGKGLPPGMLALIGSALLLRLRWKCLGKERMDVDVIMYG